jgi:hypothetical protein
MSMPEPMTAMDAIVLLAAALAIAFVAAWSVSPRLRSWIERPKYRFQKNVQSYDEAAGTAFERRNRPK